METTENNIPTTATPDTRSLILSAFMHHILETGTEPASVYKFAQSLGITESEFYTYFTSFQGVKGGIWEQVFDESLTIMHSQEVYHSYSAKEKFLSFYYIWIEVLKKNRSYLLALYDGQASLKKAMPPELRGFRDKFKAFAKGVLLEGKETGEIADRKYVSDKYEDALWLETLFVFQFWLKDTSTSFEKTDAAIEKSVSLAFDLIGRSAVDSFVDFVKFLYQSK